MNYPDGLSEGSAPWNQPEQWESEVCGTCCKCVDVELADGLEVQGCYMDGKVYQVQKNDAACEEWAA